MYCKFCGNRIASNTTKCTACGANIDLTDGGQSYFDDNELDAWQSDSLMMKGPKTYMPKTEMREVSDGDFAENYETYLQKPQASSSSRGSRSQVRRKKKKKTILDYFNLSSSNRLIIFCIASALAIVLLVVAIIAVISGGDNENQSEGQTTNSGYSQTIDDQPTTTPAQTAEPRTDVDTEREKAEKNSEAIKNKIEIKDIKVKDENGKDVPHSVSGYMSENNSLYLSLDKVLKHMGYKNGRKNGNNPNRIIYEHNTSGKVVEIEKDTNMIWITSPGETATTDYLSGNNFNVGDDTYVPIQSFLSKMGYNESKVVWDKEEKTLYFNK